LINLKYKSVVLTKTAFGALMAPMDNNKTTKASPLTSCSVNIHRFSAFWQTAWMLLEYGIAVSEDIPNC
jgi:hypothetical protein